MNNLFDNLSPIDYRYWDEEVAKYLSENGFIYYKLQVELALIRVFSRRGICPEHVLKEVEKACGDITSEEILAEEQKIQHDVRALVNCIRNRVSDKAKPYVHLTATSYDIVEPANAARYKDVITHVLIPRLVELEEVLIRLALREAETLQIGRTHGQHAIPITFGFMIAGYISRLGNSIEMLKTLRHLPGKFSGAVGAYNASSLLMKDPELFEEEVLKELGLTASEHSTQIVPQEALARLLCEVTLVSGILANLSDDMRHLQRTEISEVGEFFDEAQVGSSTMPQKRNPIAFENAKSIWKIVVSRIVTVFMDQISEHQRDLTNSASKRTYAETIGYVASITKRLTRTMNQLRVDSENLNRNFQIQKGTIVAEPLYVILSSLGHPDAHETVRKMTIEARKTGQTLEVIMKQTPELIHYRNRITESEYHLLAHPEEYIGIAAEKTRRIAQRWAQRLNAGTP